MTSQYQTFWSVFEEYIRREGYTITLKQRSPRHQHFRMNLIADVPQSHAHFAVVVTQEDSRVLPHPAGKRVELVLEKKYAEHYFGTLLTERASIDAQIRDMDWHDAPIGRASHVDLWRPHNLDNPDAWDEDFEWLLDNLILFRRVLGPLVRDARERLRL